MSDSRPPGERIAAGVIGVGNMGQNHARVYSELPGATLVGVHDVDEDRAARTAADHRTSSMSRSALLDAADVVSVAVPTEHHFDAVEACIERGVHVLVEKPFVETAEQGRTLARLASEAGVTLQVGHVERFNPAVQVLADLVPDLDVIGVDVDRLGPPLDRENRDNVVMDLMIHDLDILLWLVDDPVTALSAVAHDEDHVTAQFKFESDTVATLTASRRTQQKVRQLSLTAVSCRVNVDLTGQSVEIHRRSQPKYVETDGSIRYRQESVVERPIVETGEPLRAELAAFLDAVETGSEPVVTAADALEVMTVIERVETDALGSSRVVAR